MTRRRQTPPTLGGAWGWIYAALRQANPQVRRVVLSALDEEPAPTASQVEQRVRSTEHYQQGLVDRTIRR